LVVWDENREKALSRLESCLQHYAIGGVTTNIDYLRRIAGSTPFKQAQLTTDFIERHNESISTQTSVDVDTYLPAIVLGYLLSEQNQLEGKPEDSPWNIHDSYRSNLAHPEIIELLVNDKLYSVSATMNIALVESPQQWTLHINEVEMTVSGSITDDTLTCSLNGVKTASPIMFNDGTISLFTSQGMLTAQIQGPDLGEVGEDDHANAVVAPMNGTVVALLVKAGDKVTKGQQLIIVEAMKMEHSIKAPYDGTVAECFFNTGDLVSGGVALIDITKSDAE
jgi:3-methylcrotonyl-CoA carboxylase alpha subunit